MGIEKSGFENRNSGFWTLDAIDLLLIHRFGVPKGAVRHRIASSKTRLDGFTLAYHGFTIFTMALSWFCHHFTMVLPSKGGPGTVWRFTDLNIQIMDTCWWYGLTEVKMVPPHAADWNFDKAYTSTDLYKIFKTTDRLLFGLCSSSPPLMEFLALASFSKSFQGSASALPASVCQNIICQCRASVQHYSMSGRRFDAWELLDPLDVEEMDEAPGWFMDRLSIWPKEKKKSRIWAATLKSGVRNRTMWPCTWLPMMKTSAQRA